MLRRTLPLLITLTALVPTGLASAAPCGPLPAEYPIFSRTTVDIKDDVTMNGVTVSNGATGANSVVEIDATRSVAPQTMPDLDPPTFPTNSSTTDATHADAPFAASTDVYYRKITIGANQSATFSGGGPFHIDELRIDEDGTANMAAGIYFIDHLHVHGDRAAINVVNEPVIIHIGQKINAHGRDLSLNSGGSVAGLQLFLHSNTEGKFGDRTDFTGVVYGFTNKKMDIPKDSTIRGAVMTVNEVEVDDDVQWTYTAADQALLSRVSTCQPTEHFGVAHDTAAEICTIEPVTVSFHEPFHAVDATYVGTATLSTSTGNGTWTLISGSGTLTNLGGGVATYAFVGADAGSVQLGLRDRFSETVNIDVTDGTYSEGLFHDVDLVFSAATTDEYRDDFDSVSYANDDGDISWATNWIELDLEAAGPASGNVQITGGELRLDDYPNTDVDSAVQRELDLSSHSNATVSFDYRTSSGVDSNDSLFFEVSSNGGSSWTVLENFVSISGATSGSRTYDITAYIASNTRVRFRVDGLNGTGGTTCCYGASNEWFYVDDFRVDVPGAGTCGADHFSIDHDGTAINCQEEPITIEAHESSDAIDAFYTGSITLSTSTSHGDWTLITGAGTLVNSGSGVASYGFDPSDSGTVVLGLTNTFAETININLDDGTVTESSSEDPDLTYSAAGFNFLADGVKNALGTQIGGKASNVAPGAQTIEVQAVRTSDDTGACEAALTGSNSIDLAFECLDPATCGAAQMTVNGTPITANDAGASLSYTSIPIDFGGATDSTAEVILNYPDVGRVRVHARNTLTPSNETVIGGSNGFVARPFGFDVGVTGNPGASTATGTIFTTAGEDFGASIAAKLWQAADDADSDGVPDGHGDTDPTNNVSLADNAAAPSYGRETSPENVRLSSALFAPSAGNDPGLGGGSLISSFASGAGSTSTVYWDEVGVIEVIAGVDDGDYLGIGGAETLKLRGRSGYVGRFTPHDFAMTYNVPAFDTGCAGGNFTYVGEDITYDIDPVLTVTGQSKQSTATQNYTGAWFKLTASDLTGLAYAAGSGTLSAAAPNAPDVAPAGGGAGTLTFDNGPVLSFTRTTPVAPFDAQISLAVNVIDADGVAFSGNPARFSDTVTGIGFDNGKEMRFGRLALENAFGSELIALAVPLRAQYWTGAYFAPNAIDSCTPATVPSLALTPDPVSLSSTPSLGPVLSAGDAGLSLSSPGAGNTGSFDLVFDLSPSGQNVPWLQFDWDGDGLHDDNPTGRATFGVFSGNDQVIYRREIY